MPTEGKTAYIFVTGGVVSSLGKGVAAASIGVLLQARAAYGELQALPPGSPARAVLSRRAAPWLAWLRDVLSKMPCLEGYWPVIMLARFGEQRGTA